MRISRRPTTTRRLCAAPQLGRPRPHGGRGVRAVRWGRPVDAVVLPLPACRPAARLRAAQPITLTVFATDIGVAEVRCPAAAQCMGTVGWAGEVYWNFINFNQTQELKSFIKSHPNN